MTAARTILPADYHTHTRLCQHAAGEPLDYARVARRQGLPGIAVTDHGPTPLDYDTRHRMEMDSFPEYLRWVETAQLEEPGRILLGIEADYFEGCESFMEGWLAAHPFDLVLGSIHYLEPPPREKSEAKHLWDFGAIRAAWKRYFEFVGRMADSGLYDIVSHLDMLKRNGSRPLDRDLRDWARPALDRIASAGMAIEINTSGLRHAVREMYPSPQLLIWARERDIPIVFGSDAHEPEQVGFEFDRALRQAQECGYTHALRFQRRVGRSVPLNENISEDGELKAVRMDLQGAGQPSFPLDINTCTVNELESVRGIGPTLARRIVEARPHPTLENLLKIRGIRPAQLQTWREFLVAN